MANNYTLTSYRLGYEKAYGFYNGFVANTLISSVGYIMVGKHTQWDANDTPQPSYDTEMTQFDMWNTYFGGKRITGNDVYLVLPRRDWTANTIYTQYDDRSNTQFTSTNSMYVYTSAGIVYKCIDNANGAYSTIEPTGDYTLNDGFIALGDGYTWKYMYKVPTNNKFLTNAWIPVPTTQTAAYFGDANNLVDGAISRFIVVDGGDGWSNTNCTVNISGSGVAATANVNVASGNVTTVTVGNRGVGYRRDNTTVTVTGSGANANIRVILSPYGGHGFNPARELAANTVMISVKIGDVDSTEDGNITANNDFRQLGLLLRPHKYGENTAVSSSNANVSVTAVTQIILTSGSSYTVDELVYQGTSPNTATFWGYVSDVFTNAVEITTRHGVPSHGYALIGATSGVSRTVVTHTDPDLEPETGDIVYAENRAPVTRSVGQGELVKIVLTF